MPTLEEVKQVEITRTSDAWTNVQIDSTVLSSFMSCPCKMNYVFNRRLVPVEGPSKSIQKGQLSHVGLHAYWKERINSGDYQVASRAAVDAVREEMHKFSNMDNEEVLDVLQTLIEFFKFIGNLSWIPVFAEQHFRFKAYESEELRLRIYLTGRIDLGMKTPTNVLVPIDHKSESERWFYSQMSNQFKIYCLACKSNIIGVQRFGFQKTIEPKDKFKMEILSFDPDVLEEWRTITLPHHVIQLLTCMENEHWPMNTASCVHGHFKCIFSDGYDHKGICNVSREVREQKLARYFTIGEEWNPENF